eukprot:1159928-Pelagomonas_calceolata.AAC.9
MYLNTPGQHVRYMMLTKGARSCGSKQGTRQQRAQSSESAKATRGKGIMNTRYAAEKGNAHARPHQAWFVLPHTIWEVYSYKFPGVEAYKAKHRRGGKRRKESEGGFPLFIFLEVQAWKALATQSLGGSDSEVAQEVVQEQSGK